MANLPTMENNPYQLDWQVVRHAGNRQTTHTGTRVTLLVADLHVRVVNADTGQLRELTLDPTRDYQPRGVKPGPQPA